MEDEDAAKDGRWKWAWPEELATTPVNYRDPVPSPIYLPEEAIAHDPDDDKTPVHPDLNEVFDGWDVSPHRGRLYRPAPRLRLWQQKRAKEQQELQQHRRAYAINSKNPYDSMR